MARRRIILCAPAAFKGSMDAAEAARAMTRGVRRAGRGLEPVEMPLSDGGEGFAVLLTRAIGGRIRRMRIQGPLPSMRVTAKVGWHEKTRTAIIESAQAAGLTLLTTRQRNPRKTDTRGLGEMIRRCLAWQPRQILIGLGGTSTCDGGLGMLRALGWQFEFDSKGNVVRLRGGMKFGTVRIIAACDVDNPLLGANGAAHVFAPQKGARPPDVRWLEARMRSLADAAVKAGYRDFRNRPGAGAAGGLGWALMTFPGAMLKPGIDLFLDAVAFEKVARRVDLVLTGEGSLDRQSLSGKAPVGLARRARRAGVPVMALAGRVALSSAELRRAGILEAVPIAGPSTDEAESMRNAKRYLAEATCRLAGRAFHD